VPRATTPRRLPSPPPLFTHLATSPAGTATSALPLLLRLTPHLPACPHCAIPPVNIRRGCGVHTPSLRAILRAPAPALPRTSPLPLFFLSPHGTASLLPLSTALWTRGAQASPSYHLSSIYLHYCLPPVRRAFLHYAHHRTILKKKMAHTAPRAFTLKVAPSACSIPPLRTPGLCTHRLFFTSHRLLPVCIRQDKDRAPGRTVATMTGEGRRPPAGDAPPAHQAT